MSRRILHLTIKRKYFMEILRGEKLEEYREIKPYWEKRLLNPDGSFKKFDEVHLRNGYAKDSRYMRFRPGAIFRGTRYFMGSGVLCVFVIPVSDFISANVRPDIDGLTCCTEALNED